MAFSLKRLSLALFLLEIGCGPTLAIPGLPGEGGSGGPANDDGSGMPPSPSTTTTGVPPNPSTTAVDDTGPATVGTDGPNDEGESESSDDSSFIVHVDGTTCLDQPPGYLGHCWECDVWAQDCARGDKCVPWSNDGSGIFNGTRCSEVMPSPALIGQPCTVEGSPTSGIDDCELGAVCYGVDPETNLGTCAEQCAGTAAEAVCPEGLSCAVTFDGTINLCLPTCDPVGAACPVGSGCLPVGDVFYCLTQALEVAGHAEDCGHDAECGSGLLCLDGEAPGCDATECCVAYCDLNAGDPNPLCPDAAAGQLCTAWYEDGEAPEGFEHVGVCL